MAALRKVLYRPIEAAIRWSGLIRHEQQILKTLEGRAAPDPSDFSAWPALHFNTERIFDGILNKELPFAINGLASDDSPRLDDPSVMVRHVQLKTWMERYYPSEKPPFLFSWLERSRHPTITIEMVRALLVERDSLTVALQVKERELQAVHQSASRAAKSPRAEPPQAEAADASLSLRSETTYLHIVGALLHLLLGRSPSGQPYSSFTNQEAVISAMIAHHGERLGIAERTLRAKFAAAKRRLASMP